MIDLQVDMTKANAVLREYCEALGIVNHGSVGAEGRAFVKRQCALLTDALIKQTPPLDPRKTRDAIEKNINARFDAIRNPKRNFENRNFVGTSGRKVSYKWTGAGIKLGVDWYGFTSDGIYGIAEDKDMRDASVDDLYNLQFRIHSGGKVKVGHRGKQAVYISAKTAVKEATVKKLIARMKRHVGRLKAAWLPARDATGGKPVAQWIQKHRNGARGEILDALNTSALPNMTLINRGKGARGAEHGAHVALMSRVGAMASDMRLMLKGVKARTDILAGRR